MDTFSPHTLLVADTLHTGLTRTREPFIHARSRPPCTGATDTAFLVPNAHARASVVARSLADGTRSPDAHLSLLHAHAVYAPRTPRGHPGRWRTDPDSRISRVVKGICSAALRLLGRFHTRTVHVVAGGPMTRTRIRGGLPNACTRTTRHADTHSNASPP